MSETVSAKEKVSIYLNVEIMEKLEEIVFHERKDLMREYAKRLTKSKMSELIVEALVYNYDNGNTKKIIKDILQNWIEN